MVARLVMVVSLQAACAPHAGPREEYGGAPLHLAAGAGEGARVEALLEEGAGVGARDRYDRTPLHWAAAAGRAGACALLLDAGAELEARAWYDLTPLHWASMRNELAVMDLLIRRGALLDARDFYGRTPLHVAASDAAVKVLLEAGATLEPRDDLGMTPLHTVRTEGGAQTLLNAGADPAARARDRRRPTDMTIAANDDGPQELVLFPGAAHARLPGATAAFDLLLVSVADRPLRELAVAGESHAVAIEPPAVLPALHPGQVTRTRLVLNRIESEPPGEHIMTVTLSEGGRRRVEIELPVDTRTGVTPEDRGMTRVGTVQVRSAPSGLQWLAYGSAPLLLFFLWLIARARKRSSSRRVES
jgi:hypothetical protein